MAQAHEFHTAIRWTGNKGDGTKDYTSYERSHTISIKNKADILASSDPVFKGDGTKPNPEDFLVSAIASCHMLWYLHLCADNGIIVMDYVDNASGILTLKPEGGAFTEVTLRPTVTITRADQIDLANALHETANKKCFIANSCNFPVNHIANCIVV